MKLILATLNLASLVTILFTVYVWFWTNHDVPWWNQPLFLSAVFTVFWAGALLNFLIEREKSHA